MRNQINRREFIAGTAGLMTLAAGYPAWSGQGKERLNLAICGDMYVAGHFISAVHAYDNLDIVALCNPDQRRIPGVVKRWKERARDWGDSSDPGQQKAAGQYRRLAEDGVATFADFRRMLEELDEQIDAVVVSEFDHLHGVTCGAAMRAGKHVFCERPLGLTVQDARGLRTLAAEQRVATSIRNPGSASGAFRRGLELVAEEVIGPVEEVHIWFNRGGPDRQQPPEGSQPVPDGLHWDLWLGPAAWREYHPDWMAYAHWRDFSNGGLGTFGPHATNFPFLALKVQQLWQDGAGQAAIGVQAECSGINRLSFPRWEIVRWQIPARGQLPPVTFTWHHGPDHAPGARELIEGKMRRWGASQQQVQELMKYAGALLIGSDGAIVADDHNVHFAMLPAKKFQDVEQQRPQTIRPAQGGLYGDWIHACRGGELPLANFDNVGPLSELLMLGNVATQFAGQELQYDPVAGQIVNHAEANQALGYPYREGWTL